jgi:hypothetical protein
VISSTIALKNTNTTSGFIKNSNDYKNSINRKCL